MEKIIIVGDLFPTEKNASYFSNGDIQSLFGDYICQMFADANFRVCNLEGSLTDHEERCCKTGPIKVASTSAVNAYKKLGIDYCALANNHVTDGGHQGLLDTMQTLDVAGIKYIGAGKNEKEIARSFIREVGSMKIGFYNVGETMYNKPTKDRAGVWLYDEYVVCNDIKNLKSQCDYLIVIYHGGIEKFPYPSFEMKQRFHRMADCGANVVIAQHTHCIGSEEFYNGSWLLYGQGDFLLKNFSPGLTDSGLIVELIINDGLIQINKHFVKSVENLFVRYDDTPNLVAFEERSKKIGDEQFLQFQLQEFCSNELKSYLTAFKSPTKFRRLQKRLFPQAYNKWLFKYNKRDLMFTLHTLRSEQNRETAIVGLELLLKNRYKII